MNASQGTAHHIMLNFQDDANRRIKDCIGKIKMLSLMGEDQQAALKTIMDFCCQFYIQGKRGIRGALSAKKSWPAKTQARVLAPA